jgi:hypothetical protein
MTSPSPIVGSFFSALFPQVQQAEQTAANVAIVAAAWGLVIALELALVIWLLARRR